MVKWLFPEAADTF